MTKAIKYTLIFAFLIASLNLFSQIITVKQDGTGNFTAIQAAVDSAQNGDTVLVWPGTYVENVEITGKNITIGSLTLTTGDLSYIDQTVIDGNQSGSCIRLFSNSGKIVINGFTIRNGSGSYCGGVCGGGIYIYLSFVEITNCRIINNSGARYGGGISFDNSSGHLSNVTINNNSVFNTGGGIDILKSTVTFDSVNRCNIYENYAAVGTDIYKLGSPPMEVFVDTFTVQNPDYYYVFSAIDELPLNDISINILHHKLEQTYDNLYVSPLGDNNNSGLSPDNPLKTVSFALLKAASDSISPDTIFLDSGSYSDSLTGEKFPLNLKSYVHLKGKNPDSTILDAGYKTLILKGNTGINNFSISDLTLTKGYGEEDGVYRHGGFEFLKARNILMKNVVVRNCMGISSSAGFTSNCENVLFDNVKFIDNKGGTLLWLFHDSFNTGIHYDTITFMKCIFENNTRMDGYHGGTGVEIFSDYGEENYFTVVFNNCLFDNNISTGGPPSINAYLGCKVYLVNSTFTSNYITISRRENISLLQRPRFYCYNSIFYNPLTGYEFSIAASYSGSYRLKFFNSLILKGMSRIHHSGTDSIIYYDTTNIDADPLFYGGEEFPYNLSSQSPCIDVGTLDLPPFILDNMPDTDLAGNPRIYNGKIDMGAYEWYPTGVVNQHKPYDKPKRLKSYPNPFRNKTSVTVRMDKPANISVSVYNNNGLPVKILHTGNQQPGSFKTTWDGTDNQGNILPSGVYHIVLTVDGAEKENVKVVKSE